MKYYFLDFVRKIGLDYYMGLRFCQKDVKTMLLNLILLLSSNFLTAQSILINEVMSSNANTLTDEDGDSPDWFELFNTSSNAINLDGWHITDDADEPDKWTFPNISLPPDEFLLVFASNKDRTSGVYLHTNFKISSGGEPLFLYDANGQLVDEILPISIPTDISYGRQPDGNAVFYFFDTSSPGFSNNNNSTTLAETDELSFSHEAGWYSQAFELEIMASNTDAIVYYTQDGSIPDETSFLYQNPILIQKKNTPNQLSLISTAQRYWQEPKGNILKINTFRAVAYRNGQPSSKVYTRSFLLHENGASRYPFPVISMVTDADNLFDSSIGIHVPGDLEEPGNLQSGNYYQSGSDWERSAHMEFFGTDGTLGIEQDIGIRIHGLFSRQMPQKSIRWYARNEYDEPYLNYSFFPGKDVDKFKRLVMRSADPNNFGVPFKDELCHLLVREMGLDYQAFIPTVAFINGEYWGIFNLKERHDEHYIAENHALEAEDIDMLEGTGGVVAGSYDNFADLMAFAQQYDLSEPVNYQQLKAFFDVDNFINFLVAELYFELWDFPEGNLKFWRSQDANGAWQWLFNDGDSAMHEYWKSKMLEIISPRSEQSEANPLVLLFRKLLENEDFKQNFYQHFLYHLNHTLAPKNVLHKIDSLQAVYDPLMPEHILRWGYPSTMQGYHSATDHLRQFAALRPATLLADLKEVFDQPFDIYPNPVRYELSIRLWNGLSDEWEFQLYNVIGQPIRSGKIYDNIGTLDFSNLEAGIYFLNIKIAYAWYTVKVSKV